MSAIAQMVLKALRMQGPLCRVVTGVPATAGAVVAGDAMPRGLPRPGLRQRDRRTGGGILWFGVEAPTVWDLDSAARAGVRRT